MPLLAVRGSNNYQTLLALRKVEGVKMAFLSGEYIHVFTDEIFSPEILVPVKGVTEVRRISPNIEDVFIKIMGNGRR